MHMSSVEYTNLVQLKAYKTYNKRCRSRDGRNDLTSDLLSSIAIRRSDVVIRCAKVRSSGDKVDVIVGVIVLLELNRDEAVADQGGR